MSLSSGKVCTESETPIVSVIEPSNCAMEEVQRLLLQLVEDRVQRGREFDEQWKRCKEERVQHGGGGAEGRLQKTRRFKC